MLPDDDPAAPPESPTARLIATYGSAVFSVGYGSCSEPGCSCTARVRHPWTYTVGLSEAGLPELVVMGLEPTLAHHAAMAVANRRRAGQPVPIDRPLQLDGVRLKVLLVPDEWVLTDTARMAAWFRHFGRASEFGPLPDVQQVVVADRLGRFPGDPGCDARLARDQPILRDAPHRYPRQSLGPRQRHPRRGQRRLP